MVKGTDTLDDVINGAEITPVTGAVDKVWVVTHPRTENHIDLPVDLTNPYNWEQLMPADSAHDNKVWWQSIAYPKSENTSGQTITYRYRYEWQTTTHQDRYDPEPTPTPVAGEPTPTPAPTPSSGYPGSGSGPAPGDTRLWGHNGSHTASLVAVNGDYRKTQVRFQSLLDNWSWSTPSENGPSAKDANVQNMTVIEAQAQESTGSSSSPVYNDNYIKFDPDNEDEFLVRPLLTFKIDDKYALPNENLRYVWTVHIKDVSRADSDQAPDNATIKGTRNASTQPIQVSFRINDPLLRAAALEDPRSDPTALDSQQGILTEWGTYAFDISVEKIGAQGQVIDELTSIRSSHVSIPELMPGPLADATGNARPGFELGGWATDTEDFKWYASYYLESDRDASDVNLQLINADLVTIESLDSGKQKRRAYIDVQLHRPTESDLPGDQVGIWIIKDNHPDKDRAHKEKHMRARGKKAKWVRADNFRIREFGDTLFWNRFFQWKVGYAAKDWPSFTKDTFKNNIVKSNMGYSNSHICVPGGVGSDGGNIVAHPLIKPDGTQQRFPNTIYISDFQRLLQLDDLLLMIYNACGSGLDGNYPDRSTQGNLLQETVKAGAYAAVGYTENTYYDAANLYNFYLWESLTSGTRGTPNQTDMSHINNHDRAWYKQLPKTTRNPVTLGEALKYAARQVNAFGNGYGGYNSDVVWTRKQIPVGDPDLTVVTPINRLNSQGIIEQTWTPTSTVYSE